MPAVVEIEAVDQIRTCAHRLSGGREDFDPLLDLIGEAQFVLLGEASHEGKVSA